MLILSKNLIAAATAQLLVTSTIAFADGACQSTYQYATRDIDIDTKINQQLDWTFDKYCNKDGSKQTLSNSASLGIVFDDLPFNFKSNNGATNERASEFCRDYSAQRYNYSRYFHYKNDVQVAALESFNQCIALEMQGIAIAYSPNGLVGGSINGTFKDRTTALVINAVSYDKKLVGCKISSGDFRSAAVIDDSKPMSVDKNFTIACRRSAQKEAGKQYYPSTDIRLDTNSGGYSVHLEGDALNGFYEANDAKLKYDKAITDLNNSRKETADLRARLSKVTAKVFNFSTGQGAQVPCEKRNQAGLDEYARKVCGPDKILSYTDFGTNPGRQCGYHHYAVACIDVGK